MDIKSTLIQVRAWTRPIAGAASAEESATVVAAWGCDCSSCVQRLRRLRRMGAPLPSKEEIFPE
jgi:hypothetical protein